MRGCCWPSHLLLLPLLLLLLHQETLFRQSPQRNTKSTLWPRAEASSAFVLSKTHQSSWCLCGALQFLLVAVGNKEGNGALGKTKEQSGRDGNPWKRAHWNGLREVRARWWKRGHRSTRSDCHEEVEGLLRRSVAGRDEQN